MMSISDQPRRYDWKAPLRARFPIAKSAGIECFKGWQPILARMLERLEAAVAQQETRWALARAVWASPKGRGRAPCLAKAARLDYAEAGDASAVVAEIDAWLAAVGTGKKPS